MKQDKEKDINKMFTGLAVSRSVTISKARPKKRALAIVILFLAIAISIGFFIYTFLGRSNFLAQRIGSDAQAYIGMNIPDSDSFFSRVSFWNKSSAQNNLSEIYNQIALFGFANYGFDQDILAAIKGTAEFAILENGEFVFTAELKNKEFALDDNSYESYVEDNRLFIATSQLLLTEIKNKPNHSIADILKTGFKRNIIGLAYINNLSSDNPYINAFSSGLDKPFTLFIQEINNNIVFKTNLDSKDMVSDNPISPINHIYQVSDTDIGLYFKDIGLTYNQLFSDSGFLDIENNGDNRYADINASIGKTINENLEELLIFIGEIYNTNTLKIADNIGKSEVLALVSEAQEQKSQEHEWIIISSNIDLNIFKEFAAAVFAKEHPIRVEHILRDRSLMTELRIDTKGIVWDDFAVNYNNQDLEFNVLQAQGEINAYFTGHVPELGNILTNSQELLNIILRLNSGSQVFSNNHECEYSGNISARFKGKILSSNPAIRSNIDYAIINSEQEDKLSACIILQD